MGAAISKDDDKEKLTNVNHTTHGIQEIIHELFDNDETDEQLIQRCKNASKTDNLLQYRDGIDSMSLLHLAVKSFRTKVVFYLINDMNFDVNLLSGNGQSILHTLVQTTIGEETRSESQKNELFEEIFKFLVKKKIKVNIQDDKGSTPLHLAVRGKNKTITMALVHNKDINIYLEDKRSMAPLQVACNEEVDSITSLLIENTDAEQLVKPSANNFPLHILCKLKNEKKNLIELVLNKLKSASTKKSSKNYLKIALNAVDSFQQPMLHMIIERGHSYVLESLVKNYKVDLKQKDGNGNRAIHLVAKTGSMKIFKIIQDNDGISSEQNNKMENPLHIAAYFNSEEFIKVYLELENNGKIVSALKSTIPSIQTLNKVSYTPLLVAIHSNNQKVFEILAEDKNAKLNVKSQSGNTAYHVCAESGNVNSLRYLLKNFYGKNPNIFTLKNRQDNTVLHLAAVKGALEIISLAYETMKNSSSFENFLFAKNNIGQTFFHLACLQGHISIVEFFVTQLKMITLLEQTDNNLNTALHLATENGHANLVSLLLDNTTNLLFRNEENLTTYEISCRKGFAQISKNIITRGASAMDNSEFPLHVACYEGALETVELLLSRGIVIDTLNHDNDNCLDISIKQNHENVIRVLLVDPNWKALFKTSKIQNNGKKKIVIENPQFMALYEAKMWEILELILNKCYDSTTEEVDFTILDPPTKNKGMHPLMFCARSGQEGILKHEACLLLLKLKWRLVPRLVYYTNLMLSTTFLLLMLLLCFEIVQYRSCTDNCVFNSTLYFFITLLVSISMLKTLVEFIVTDKIGFLLSIETWLEISVYISTLIAINTSVSSEQIDAGSWAVLAVFLTYPFYLQKMRVLGVYVVAVIKTLKNSAQFVPIFMIVLMGFILNFYLRHDLGIKLGNGDDNNFPFAVIKSIAMAIGDISTVDDFQLNEHSSLTFNWFIYLLFILIICVVMFNLFVGIAVSDIGAVLGEADIRFLNLRIVYSLKIEGVIEPLTKKNEFLKRKFNMNFQNFNSESDIIQKLQQNRNQIFKWANASEGTINLADPQKRLEDMFKKMNKNSDQDNENLEKLFKSKLDELENKVAQFNRTLYLNLIELQNNTDNGFSAMNSSLTSTNNVFFENFSRLEGNLKGFDRKNSGTGIRTPPPPQIIEKKPDKNDFMLQNTLNEKFSTVENQITELQQKFEGEMMDLKSTMNFFIKSMNESLKSQTNEIQNALFLSESSIRTDLNETGKVIGKGFIYTKQSMNQLDKKLDHGVKKGAPKTDFNPIIPILPQAESFSGIAVEIPNSAGSSSHLIPEDKKERVSQQKRK